ncbi:wat1-related protein at1g43650 [Phtheirospermum japonicum]|uniref:WAT1-related protein n=1 Tax=Phtheirospermum japonicum TaxID=374723 RepID=A0A830CS01_9LAMI|nr:wat1-related protein at1g43650 [Phtheirospermum japonicum]
MIFVQLAYAGMAMFSKSTISNGMSPYVFVAYRQAFATIALAPFAYFLDRKKADPMSYGLIWKVFLISLFGISLSLNLYSYAIKYVSATFASASINTIPSLTFVIAIALRIESLSIREFPGILKIVGSVISLSGAMVFAFVKGPQVNFLNWIQHEKNSITHFSTKENWVQGCLLMLLANIAWACWLVMQAPLVKQYPAKFRLTMLQCLFSCIQSSVWAMSIERDFSSWSLQWDFNLFSVAYCGLVVTGISYWLQLWAVENKGPLFAATFTPLTLIFTAVLSAFIWKEMLYLGSICGGMLLIGGLYCVIWGKNKEASQKEANEEITDAKEETNIV